MTQALNLSQFANKIDASGKASNDGLQNSAITINTTSPITGGASPALGGTLTLSHANSGVTAASYSNANITVNAQGHITAASNGSAGSSGTVTSVATGNGLQGGTINTSGTLSIACPGFNTVGSYALGGPPIAIAPIPGTYGFSSGANYSAGSGHNQVGSISTGGTNFSSGPAVGENNLSGTWKWMSASWGWQPTSGDASYAGLICRVS